ncbi:nuclease-related domain-containing protein [Thiocystis violascens]|uniref:Zn-finger domain-containing protein (Topoisomerase type I-like) n=1 Tax=Thiocystis violascens (strain ATCC 17096 / DSM 198 / 6111) TaxID=765911 RepID=I3Y5H4_THIV6|nr:NERD domain-containing protein [Thiocystis violascens]AFL72242.1 Zn-finger domain-containing protein (topoisomerase type I-like) [Thiocystis violascens DSM 198]
MDVFLIVEQILGLVWWLIPLALLVGLLKSPSVKGYLGESRVRRIARTRLDPMTYHPLHNLTLPTPDGTTQIDHVFVSRFGLFVLETKNMTGWIFGGEHQAQWTQKIYRRTTRFQNPLRQNYKHLKALERALPVPLETIHSVVAFVGDSTFKTEMPPNVTQGNGFVRHIQSFREPVFTETQVVELVRRLQDGRLAPTLATHRAHVRSLKQRSNPDASQRCPRCGRPMILRTVKKGTQAGRRFWACSGFPDCQSTRDLP